MVRATGYPKFPLLPCLPFGRASMPSWDRQPCLYIENTSSEHVVCLMMIYSSPESSLSKHVHQFPCFMEVDTIRSHFIEKNVTRIKNANETSGGCAKHINRRVESNKV